MSLGMFYHSPHTSTEIPNDPNLPCITSAPTPDVGDEPLGDASDASRVEQPLGV